MDAPTWRLPHGVLVVMVYEESERVEEAVQPLAVPRPLALMRVVYIHSVQPVLIRVQMITVAVMTLAVADEVAYCGKVTFDHPKRDYPP